MPDILTILKARLKNTDLEEYTEDNETNEVLLDYALSYAEGEINLRRGTEIMEDRFINNKIEGAIWYLSRIGSEGMKGISENGVSFTYKDVPDWLLSVIPRLKTIKTQE